MTSESDETIQIYKVKDGVADKSLLSKKYGVKLARFTHTSSSIVYASTKQNGTPLLDLRSVIFRADVQKTRSGTSLPTTTPSSAT